MKIATLTLPFHPNYGAVLQAYALQKILKELGHDVSSIDLERRSLRKLSRYYLSRIKSILTGGELLDNHQYGNKKFKYFIKSELKLTKKLKYERDFQRADIQDFDAYIVGSDQVWRPKYVINIERYFLNFINKEKTKISYAASFGTEFFDYTNDDKIKCSKLAEEFNAISVREGDGLKICEKEFLLSATLVLDPTFLINVDYYNKLINKYDNNNNYHRIFCYILDHNESKIKTIKTAFADSFFINGEMGCKDAYKACIGTWLKGIRDSEIVITDSFHGVVFSIIFNKNFVAIGNKKRGLARFTSLLNIFNLKERLIIDDELTKDNILKVLNTNIDYHEVNNILSHKKEESICFLESSLVKKNVD